MSRLHTALLMVLGIIIVTDGVAGGGGKLIGGLVRKGHRGFVTCAALPITAGERVLGEQCRQHTAQMFLAGMGAALSLLAVARGAGIPPEQYCKNTNTRVQPRSQSSRGLSGTREKYCSNKCTGASVCRKPEVQILVPVHELSPDFC